MKINFKEQIMAITNKEQLSQAILDSLYKAPPPTLLEGVEKLKLEDILAQAKREAILTSQQISLAIDEYVQHQIGIRLEGILTAINAQTQASQNVTLSAGSTFSNFTRKTSR